MTVLPLVVMLAAQPAPPAAGQDALSWRAALAGLDLAVDAYRLSLKELNLVLAQMRARNEDPMFTNGRAPIPLVWREAFARVGRVLGSLQAESLPISVRILHEQLARTWLAAARAERPAQWLTHVQHGAALLTRIQQQTLMLQELATPAGMFQEQFLDEDQALGAITDAADNLQRTIIELELSGRSGADSGSKYPILVKMSVALRVLLERVAAASEAGYEIGFSPRLTTPDLAERISLFTQRVNEHAALIDDMANAPAAPLGVITARCSDAASDSVTVSFMLALPPETPLAAAGPTPYIQLSRRLHDTIISGAKAAVDGNSLAQAPAWQERVAQPITQLSAQDKVIPGMAYDYRVRVSSWLGVGAGEEQYRTVRCAPLQLNAAGRPVAKAVLHGSWRDDLDRTDRARIFYRRGDGVQVHWKPSPSVALPQDQPLPGAGGGPTPPVAVEYALYRSIAKEEWTLVSILEPSTLEYLDFPPTGRMRRGNSLRYLVAVRDQTGREIRGEVSTPIEVDYNFWYELAGQGYFEYSYRDLDVMLGATIKEIPDHVRAVVASWLEDAGSDQYPQVLPRYWKRIPEQYKRRWYAMEQQNKRDGNSLCVLQGPDSLVTNDSARMITELYLADRSEAEAAEPARWWMLLTDTVREQYLRSWWQTLGEDQRQALAGARPEQSLEQALVPGGDGDAPWAGLDIQTLSPGVVHSFHQHLDSVEKRMLGQWWYGQPKELRSELVAKWWAVQSMPWRRTACFPSWNRLTEVEQKRFIAEGYHDLGSAVRLTFLPYVWFQAVDWADKAGLVAHNESSTQRTLRGIRYGPWRIVDRMVGFKLRFIAIGLSFLLVTAVLLRRWRRRTRFARM